MSQYYAQYRVRSAKQGNYLKQRTFAFPLTTVVVKYIVLKESDISLISRVRTLIFEILLIIISVVKAGANGVRKV